MLVFTQDTDGNYGTKMYIATTDSYATGSKTAITIQHDGDVAVNRGHFTISTITNSSSDTDKFLVSNSGQVQYRTGAQVLSDIGGAPATGGAYLPLAGGTMTGPIDFNGTSGDHGEFEWTSGDGTTGDVWSLGFYQNSAFRASIEFFATTEAAGDGNIRFKSGNTTTLTLDASQNATFAGDVITSKIFKVIGADTQTNVTASATLGLSLKN